MPVILGIDLGTTKSCVAVFKDGTIEVIESSDYGNRTVPSRVAFDDRHEKPLVGEAAFTSRNPANTIYGLKRLIVLATQSDSLPRPSNVVDRKYQPSIKVIHCNEEKELSPEKISAYVLRKLIDDAKARLRASEIEAVIPVPVGFTYEQRLHTKMAGTLAGLKKTYLISEPTAAALSYGLERRVIGKRTVLVFCLGGGTFGVSVVAVDDVNFVVQGSGGKSTVGGTDIDNVIVHHVVQEIKTAKNIDVSGDPRKMQRLLSICEKAKRQLSCTVQSHIDLEPVLNEDFTLLLTQAKVEELCQEVFAEIREEIDNALQHAKIKAGDIDEITLVGGAARMPAVVRLLTDKFPGKHIGRTVLYDEAVAHGAALWAAHLAGDTSDALRGLTLDDPYAEQEANVGPPNKKRSSDSRRGQSELGRGEATHPASSVDYDAGKDSSSSDPLPTGTGHGGTELLPDKMKKRGDQPTKQQGQAKASQGPPETRPTSGTHMNGPTQVEQCAGKTKDKHKNSRSVKRPTGCLELLEECNECNVL